MNVSLSTDRIRELIPPGIARALLGLLLLTPVLILLIYFFAFPLFNVLMRSFTEPETGFGNYQALWESRAFRNIMQITFEIAVVTTLVCLVMAYPFAYRLSTIRRPLANFFLLLSLIPFWTAILARLYSWTIILGRRGILNEWLMDIGIINEPLDLLFNRQAVIIGMVHVMLPYMIIILYSTMISIDRTLLDASRSLGAGGFQTFRRVFLPLSMSGVYAGCLLVFIISLGFFITPAVLGGGGDVTIAIFVQQQVAINRWGAAAAMSVVLLVVTVVLFFLFNRLFGAERLMAGGIRK
jgi:ABC-type spermidine/putrescine transport system permease subunit I